MDVFQGMEPEQQPAGMTDEDLVRILKDEASEATSYHDSELAKNQEDALNRYFARPYGNEEADTSRSSVVTHDLEDTINWMMPDLMRCFTSADDLVSVEELRALKTISLFPDAEWADGDDPGQARTGRSANSHARRCRQSPRST